MKNIITEYGNINIATENESLRDFHLQKGFIVLDRDMAAKELSTETISEVVVTMVDLERGWCRAFTETANGWEMDFPELDGDFAELLNDLQEVVHTFQAKPEEELYMGCSFSVTDVIPGEKCHNGGEYGFYTDYIQTDIPGLYAVETSTTCDFDRCGTGFEGLRWLTLEDYSRIAAASLEPLTETAKDYSSPTLQLFQ